MYRIFDTSIGNSLSLFYPEGILFSIICWLMKERSIVGALPTTLLSEDTNRFWFTTVSDHTQSRLTTSSY